MEGDALLRDPSTSLEGEARVWWVRTKAFDDPASRERLETLLSPDEIARRDRLVREADRLNFTVARAHLRSVLAHYGGVPARSLVFRRDDLGRPELTSPRVESLQFSLTHTQGFVACVVARRCECGVDAEPLARHIDIERVAARVLADREARARAALPPEARRERFFELWTLKEAYLKARGLGFRIPARSVSFELGGARIALHSAPPGDSAAGRWRFELLRPLPAHAMAVALRPNEGAPSPALTAREGTPGSFDAAPTAPRGAPRAG